MESEIAALQTAAVAAIATAPDARTLEDARIKYLGKQGEITRLSEGMRHVAKEDRPRLGKALNELRQAVTAALDGRTSELAAAADATALASLDITLPGTRQPQGSLHPLTQLLDRAVQIFRRMGFILADGPDIETEWHCFDALNTPADHPARNEQDTFYLPDGRLLRTHTSTVQIRVMESQPPPVRIISPGAAYRRDEVDATHLAQFTQMEGLYVDRHVSVADLKGTLEYFFRELFGPGTETRFRPHFFPFTEPSFEVDCSRTGSQVKGREWLEICGCGMVDPAVFEQVGYDPEKYTGYAFGFGIERIAIMRYGIPDLRFFTDNDVRFLRQFSTRIDG